VIDRQEAWSRARNERLQSLARAVSDAEQSACSFAPNISAASRLSDRTFLSDDVRFARAAAGGASRPAASARASASAPLRRNADIDAFAGRLALARQRAAEDAAYAEAVYSPRRHGASRTVRRKDADAVAPQSPAPPPPPPPPPQVAEEDALFDGTAQPRLGSSALYAVAVTESPLVNTAQPRAFTSSAGSFAASLYATAVSPTLPPVNVLQQPPSSSSSGVARMLLSPQTGQVTWRTTVQK
jgi:hypothetical protein